MASGKGDFDDPFSVGTLFHASSAVFTLETRTAWAVFKYCGTKTVTLRMRKKIWKDWFKIYIKRNKQNKG